MARRPVPPAEEATPEWMTLVSQNSSDIRLISLDVGTCTQVTQDTTDEQTFTITGINTDDVIISVTKPTHQVGLGIVNSRVTADNTIGITYIAVGGNITPTADEIYTIILLKNRI